MNAVNVLHDGEPVNDVVSTYINIQENMLTYISADIRYHLISRTKDIWGK
jgi:hypothetical protein